MYISVDMISCVLVLSLNTELTIIKYSQCQVQEKTKRKYTSLCFFFYFHLLTLKLLTAVKNLCAQNMLQHRHVCVSYLTTKIAFLVPQTSVW